MSLAAAATTKTSWSIHFANVEVNFMLKKLIRVAQLDYTSFELKLESKFTL